MTTNNTNFVNKEYPGYGKTANTCILKMKAIDPNVCQLRLDFITFEIGQPNAEGVCEGDFMEVLDTKSTTPLKICGINTGQHSK